MHSTEGFYAIWDSRLTDDERKLVHLAAEFARATFAPFTKQSRTQRLPLSRDIVRAWARLGLQRLQTPREFGGHGASYFAKIRIVQELARHGFAAAFSLNNSHSMATAIATQAGDEVRQRYLPGLLDGELVATVALTEAQGGSDLSATRTSARKVDGGWLINGEKAWITNATIADLAFVTAQTAEGTRGIGRFIVPLDAAGAERTGAHAIASGHAVGLGGLRFNDVLVPDSHLLEAPGEGFKRAMDGINGARVHVAAMAVAAMERALQEAVRYCGTREAFGKPLLEQQGLRWRLVDVANHLEAANMLVFRGSELIHDGLPVASAAAHAKKFAAGVAVDGIEGCIQCMGAHALLDDIGLVHQLAEVKMAGFADGTTEILNERIGSQLLKQYGEIK
jgi:acrylyl-CoA reductase (NADPH)